jgi:hypothetical protein
MGDMGDDMGDMGDDMGDMGEISAPKSPPHFLRTL